MQEYSPRHEKVVPKMNWEMEQMSYSQNCEIAMPKDGNAIMEAELESRPCM
jgi:hypothetical protein